MESATMLIFLFAWLALAAVVGTIGSDRKIGYAGVFWLSVFFSPIVGALVGLGSERKQPAIQLDKNSVRLLAESSKLAKESRREEAIAKLKELLALQPRFAIPHYNLACNYSHLRNADDAFQHLATAVSLGYNDFKKIQSDPDLAFLRSQPEFSDFAASGYRVISSPRAPEDTVSQLERLAALKDKGVLTESEFLDQKAKILKGSRR